jgi:hypothetical protein
MKLSAQPACPFMAFREVEVLWMSVVEKLKTFNNKCVISFQPTNNIAGRAVA